jgi:hypothetical protein
MYNIFELCDPAFIYFLLMSIIICIDIYKQNFDKAIVKILPLFIVTYILSYLCNTRFFILSYIFIFLPLIITTLSISYLLLKKGNLTTDEDINNENTVAIDKYNIINSNNPHGYES